MVRKKRINKKYIKLLNTIVALLIPLLIGAYNKRDVILGKTDNIPHVNNTKDSEGYAVTNQSILPFSQEKQMNLGDLDSLGRATDSHIQLYASQVPQEEREARLKYNPVGWYNYKIDDNWLMNRGHLVGYLFSGLNDEPKNLTPITRYVNAGTIENKRSDESNPEGMLFYEKKLKRWLMANPHSKLDYQVSPMYLNDELLARKIRVTYVGLDSNGNTIPLSVGGKETILDNNVVQVILDNVSPNAELDYKTGMIKK